MVNPGIGLSRDFIFRGIHRGAVMRLLAIAGAIALICFPLTSQAAREWTRIRIGTEGAYPPFNYLDANSQLRGFDIDIARALCTEMRVQCQFVTQEWRDIIPGLLARNYDAIIASMSITEERKKQVLFTKKYYSTVSSFVAAADTDITDTSPQMMLNYTIGAQQGTTHAAYLQSVYQSQGVKVLLYATQDEANLDLSQGNIDAVLGDKVSMLEWIEKSPEGNCCRFVGQDINDPRYYGEGIGIAVRPSDEDLRDMFNSALANIIKNGTYKKINDKYFPFSIY